jgi:hypothetical protein
MKLALAALGLTVVSSVVLMGCSAGADGTDPTTSDELRTSAQCPAEIEVHLSKPRIYGDRKLLEMYTEDWQSTSQDHAAEYAQSDLDSVQPFLAVARADDEVTLRGTNAGACTYKTVDAATGQPNDYHVWIRPTSNALRIDQGLDQADSVIFYDVALKSVSSTKIEIDSRKPARVSAENTSRGHDGSDGWVHYIGNIDATVKIIH